jgi:hypothetical protein
MQKTTKSQKNSEIFRQIAEFYGGIGRQSLPRPATVHDNASQVVSKIQFTIYILC